MWNRIFMAALAISCFMPAIVLGRDGRTSTATHDNESFDPSPAVVNVSSLQNKIAELRFDDTPIERAFNQLEQMSHAHFAVRWHELEQYASITRDQPVRLHLWDVTLEQALTILCTDLSLSSCKLDFLERDGVIFVSTDTAIFTYRDDVTRIYNIRDLIESANRDIITPQSNATSDIADLLSRQVVPESWTALYGLGSIREFGGLLIIHQTPQIHHQIETFLNQLREADKKRPWSASTQPAKPAP